MVSDRRIRDFGEQEKEICDKYLQGMSLTKLGKEYKTKRDTLKKLLIKNNIKIRNRSEACANIDVINKQLTEEQIQLIVGSTLGDGYIRIQSKDGLCYLDILHCIAQKGYLDWKVKILGELVSKIYNTDAYNATICGKMVHCTETFRFRTYSHPTISYVRSIGYVNGRKAITEELLNLVDKLALCVWYLDDGSLDKRENRLNARICTDRYSYQECEMLLEMLKDKFGIQGNIHKQNRNKKTVYRLWFDNINTERLIGIIYDYVVQIPCMWYKIGL